MSNEAVAHAEHAGPGMKIMYVVWGGLLALTVIEVILAWMQMSLGLMLLILLGLSVGKGYMIVAYFMHLKFERMNLILTIIPAVTICLLLFNIFYPDAMRLGEMGWYK